jgi:hypothetical protein
MASREQSLKIVEYVRSITQRADLPALMVTPGADMVEVRP